MKQGRNFVEPTELSLGPLSDATVAAAPPGRYRDSDGLVLHVRETGERCWMLNAELETWQITLRVGQYPKVSLSSARERVRQLQDLFETGEFDPSAGLYDPDYTPTPQGPKRQTFVVVDDVPLTGTRLDAL
ncbi:MAG: Arm DNA-binding domain-containing protein [Pseudomonadota bacterium]